jgi:hypothetical protein
LPLITKIYLPAFIHIELIAGKQKVKSLNLKDKIIPIATLLMALFFL